MKNIFCIILILLAGAKSMAKDSCFEGAFKLSEVEDLALGSDGKLVRTDDDASLPQISSESVEKLKFNFQFRMQGTKAKLKVTEANPNAEISFKSASESKVLKLSELKLASIDAEELITPTINVRVMRCPCQNWASNADLRESKTAVSTEGLGNYRVNSIRYKGYFGELLDVHSVECGEN